MNWEFSHILSSQFPIILVGQLKLNIYFNYNSLAGLSDEGLFLVQDIENSIIQVINRALRQAIRTITEVAGINSTDVELPYNKMIKDSIALMSISVRNPANKFVFIILF